jgi:hypothetical protein
VILNNNIEPIQKNFKIDEFVGSATFQSPLSLIDDNRVTRRSNAGNPVSPVDCRQ